MPASLIWLIKNYVYPDPNEYWSLFNSGVDCELKGQFGWGVLSAQFYNETAFCNYLLAVVFAQQFYVLTTVAE